MTDRLAETFPDFLKDRNEALLSLDLEKINAYAKKYGGMIIPDTEGGWAGIHKARTAILDFPEEERQKSRDWLAAHNMTAMG